MLTDKRQQVITEAKTFLGTPFVMNANLKGIGIDCGRLLIKVYENCGFKVPLLVPMFTSDWHLHTREERYLELVAPFTEQVFEPFPGDIVLFRVARPYAHGGIIVEWPIIIDAKMSHNVEYTNVDIDAELKTRARVFFSPYRVND